MHTVSKNAIRTKYVAVASLLSLIVGAQVMLLVRSTSSQIADKETTTLFSEEKDISSGSSSLLANTADSQFQKPSVAQSFNISATIAEEDTEEGEPADEESEEDEDHTSTRLFPTALPLPDKWDIAPGGCRDLLPEEEDHWTWEDYNDYRTPKADNYDGIPMTVHLFWETKPNKTAPLQTLRLPIMSIMLTMPGRFMFLLVASHF